MQNSRDKDGPPSLGPTPSLSMPRGHLRANLLNSRLLDIMQSAEVRLRGCTAAQLSGSTSDVTHGLFHNGIFIVRGTPAATCISLYINVYTTRGKSINYTFIIQNRRRLGVPLPSVLLSVP
jgi:hypothetical protein